jgi:hypothetical protein
MAVNFIFSYLNAGYFFLTLYEFSLIISGEEGITRVLSTPGSFVVVPDTLFFILLELLIVFLFGFAIESILSKLLIFLNLGPGLATEHEN